MRKVLIFISILIIILIVSSYIYVNLQATTITVSELAELEKKNITRISFFYQPEHKLILIDDTKKIDDFMTLLNNCIISKNEIEEDKTVVEYIYSASFLVVI